MWLGVVELAPGMAQADVLRRLQTARYRAIDSEATADAALSRQRVVPASPGTLRIDVYMEPNPKERSEIYRLIGRPLGVVAFERGVLARIERDVWATSGPSDEEQSGSVVSMTAALHEAISRLTADGGPGCAIETAAKVGTLYAESTTRFRCGAKAVELHVQQLVRPAPGIVSGVDVHEVMDATFRDQPRR
jgi:hypothetical protein